MHTHQIEKVPITLGGEKIIGIHECCVLNGCDYMRDLPLNKHNCYKCNAIIKYYDTQDLNEAISGHNLKQHRAEYYNNKTSMEG